MGLRGVENDSICKGLKSYRQQDIKPTFDTDDSIDPKEKVELDFDKYNKYIRSIAARFWKKLPKNARWDYDEFVSEAWLALVECAEKYYNPEYNDSLKAFAYPYIVKRLSEFMATNMYSLKARYYNIKNDPEKFADINELERTMWSESQQGKTSAEDVDNPMLAKPSGIESIMDECAEEEEKDIIKGIVNTRLPMRERRAIVRRYRNGETYREIGARLGVSAETARKLVMRGLEMIRKKAEDAGINH